MRIEGEVVDFSLPPLSPIYHLTIQTRDVKHQTLGLKLA